MAGNFAQRGRVTVILMIVGMIGFSAALTYFMHRNSTTDVRNLDSNDINTIIDSLTAMKERRDPSGIAKATTLLASNNPEVSNNAALYLGALGKADSIPYLINALKTDDAEIRNEISLDLTQMTGELLGDKYDAWEAWWLAKNEATSRQ